MGKKESSSFFMNAKDKNLIKLSIVSILIVIGVCYRRVCCRFCRFLI
jgi:hypothetical protein